MSAGSGIFSTMREVKVKGVSSLCTLDSNGESHILQSELASDSQRNSSLNVQFTPEIEKKYVHHVYDAIAPHFSSTRFAKWPKVANFLSSLPSGSLVLDAGCGNGKYLGFNPDCFFIGCDISAPLIKICADRGHEVLVADAVDLPYRTGFGDAAISIAVLHHLSTEGRRKKAIEELIRVVKKGGLYGEEWIGPGSPRVRSPSSCTLESIPETEENGFGERKKDSGQSYMQSLQEITSQSESYSGASTDVKNANNQQEYFVPWHLPYHRAEVSGASACALANGLAKKDDKKGAVVYNRYYHVFSEGELEREQWLEVAFYCHMSYWVTKPFMAEVKRPTFTVVPAFPVETRLNHDGRPL
ncbi:unnamed protein product [Prunus armeniaca]|uniref:Methyltransferase type 11 domain-containing protein n=1 Tax=Prunus armeniaca TaxID=36596 RepID=A0A6J5WDU8_PRUAR|nr:unnamed protein product [Prunus armeniaca]